MTDLPWNTEIMEWFVAHRVDWLTNVFLFFTFLGGEMGYILLVLGVYWLYNKRLAVQLVFAIIATTLVNHVLKIIIRNPRPFVEPGTYKEKWAIAESNIEETALSYSTPSGHAQGSSTFWWYLHLKEKSRLTFILLPIMVFAIGISRPYLGVHYLEDVIIGWIVGFIIVIFLHRYDTKVENWWKQLSTPFKYSIAILGPLIVLIGGGLLTDFGPDGTTFGTLGGIFSGIIIGGMLEQDHINFDPSFSQFENPLISVLVAVTRIIIGLIVVALMLIGLDEVFSRIADDHSAVGFFLRWVRYGLVGFSGMIIAPFIFVKLNLASTNQEDLN